jgi:O-methyltransferase
MSFARKLFNSPTFFPIRIALRKQTGLMPLTDFLVGDTVRKFNGSDIRVMRLVYCLEQTKGINQPIAECGVGSGYSLAYTISYLSRTNDRRHYHGFDTFEGFPFIHPEDLEGIPEERKRISKVGQYKQYMLSHHEKTIKKLGAAGTATLHKGLFSDTIPSLPKDMLFSFVFMDCDLYQSYKSCLEAIYPRVLPGGIILFDEYEHTVEWPGAKKAIDEFFADKAEKPELLPFGTSWIVRKH